MMLLDNKIKTSKKLLKENPDLKYYEAMRQANEMHKKVPKDCNPKGANKTNLSNYNTCQEV